MSNETVIDIDPKYLHPYCRECIKQKILQHDNVSEDGVVLNKAGTFPISCKGILNELAFEELSNGEEERRAMRMAFDRAYWCKEKLGWKPRVANEEWENMPYQEVMLNCTANRKVYRLGRRLGKCFYEGAYVPTVDGIVRWGDLLHGEKKGIQTVNIDTGDRKSVV